MKWSEVFIVSFLEGYFNGLSSIAMKRKIESVLSELEPSVWVSEFNDARYYEDAGVKKALGLMYNDLERSYANQGYGELS